MALSDSSDISNQPKFLNPCPYEVSKFLTSPQYPDRISYTKWIRRNTLQCPMASSVPILYVNKIKTSLDVSNVREGWKIFLTLDTEFNRLHVLAVDPICFSGRKKIPRKKKKTMNVSFFFFP